MDSIGPSGAGTPPKPPSYDESVKGRPPKVQVRGAEAGERPPPYIDKVAKGSGKKIGSLAADTVSKRLKASAGVGGEDVSKSLGARTVKSAEISTSLDLTELTLGQSKAMSDIAGHIVSDRERSYPAVVMHAARKLNGLPFYSKRNLKEVARKELFAVLYSEAYRLVNDVKLRPPEAYGGSSRKEMGNLADAKHYLTILKSAQAKYGEEPIADGLHKEVLSMQANLLCDRNVSLLNELSPRAAVNRLSKQIQWMSGPEWASDEKNPRYVQRLEAMKALKTEYSREISTSTDLSDGEEEAIRMAEKVVEAHNHLLAIDSEQQLVGDQFSSFVSKLEDTSLMLSADIRNQHLRGTSYDFLTPEVLNKVPELLRKKTLLAEKILTFGQNADFQRELCQQLLKTYKTEVVLNKETVEGQIAQLGDELDRQGYFKKIDRFRRT